MFDRISEGRYWDKPWSLVSGCTRCSPGCEHCWSLAMEKRFRFKDYGEFGARRHDTSLQIHPERLDIPLECKKPTVWAIWNDLFHEDVPESFIDKVWSVMLEADHHIFLLLTKRIKRASEIIGKTEELSMENNIWPGVTVCNQQEADEKIPLLFEIPSAVRWISIEPMLESIDIRRYLKPGQKFFDALSSVCSGILREEVPKVPFRKPDGLDWVVLGGETGPGARPMNTDWVRLVMDQCQATDVPFFFKQWGSHHKLGKDTARLIEGRAWNELPEVK